jgi:hypothetical protein
VEDGDPEPLRQLTEIVEDRGGRSDESTEMDRQIRPNDSSELTCSGHAVSNVTVGRCLEDMG